eukprot:TRINITY_DN2741_c1_g1_i1.p2 TRINITY_DN2741_c1_g1~~TRINITY_DN2741_c1_g1_i1.p2  ORF type:complete len:152 (-),score=16.77 TRINITY_DN2741_c1_g1_i1:898-1353(-)
MSKINTEERDKKVVAYLSAEWKVPSDSIKAHLNEIPRKMTFKQIKKRVEIIKQLRSRVSSWKLDRSDQKWVLLEMKLFFYLNSRFERLEFLLNQGSYLEGTAFRRMVRLSKLKFEQLYPDVITWAAQYLGCEDLIKEKQLETVQQNQLQKV